jgi:hypothetical protein
MQVTNTIETRDDRKTYGSSVMAGTSAESDEENPVERTLKVVVVGDGASGKTSICTCALVKVDIDTHSIIILIDKLMTCLQKLLSPVRFTFCSR